MTLRAIITPAAPVAGRRRYNVGVAGEAPSGIHVYQPRFLLRGPWCATTARQHARRLQSELNRNLHGHLLGWQP